MSEFVGYIVSKEEQSAFSKFCHDLAIQRDMTPTEFLDSEEYEGLVQDAYKESYEAQAEKLKGFVDECFKEHQKDFVSRLFTKLISKSANANKNEAPST